MLNENQLKVVNSDPNSNIVCQALAGTGKTTVLLERAKFIIKTRLANQEEPKLLLVAFSKDVANTLIGRLEDDIKNYINIKTTQALAYQEVTRANRKIDITRPISSSSHTSLPSLFLLLSSQEENLYLSMG